MRMIPSSSDKYQVYWGQTRLYVYLKKGQYLYGELMLTRISCKHVVPYVHHKRIEFGDVYHI
jgi:hypothetical protein